MPTFQEVQQNLTFLNSGANQTPGLIAMKLDANAGNYGACAHIVVLFNATNASVTFTDSRLQGLHLHLHPVQRASRDPITRQSTFDSKAGTATVPALTTASSHEELLPNRTFGEESFPGSIRSEVLDEYVLRRSTMKGAQRWTPRGL